MSKSITLVSNLGSWEQEIEYEIKPRACIICGSASHSISWFTKEMLDRANNNEMGKVPDNTTLLNHNVFKILKVATIQPLENPILRDIAVIMAEKRCGGKENQHTNKWLVV